MPSMKCYECSKVKRCQMHSRECPHCEGTGIQLGQPCPDCLRRKVLISYLCRPCARALGYLQSTPYIAPTLRKDSSR